MFYPHTACKWYNIVCIFELQVFVTSIEAAVNITVGILLTHTYVVATVDMNFQAIDIIAKVIINARKISTFTVPTEVTYLKDMCSE